MFSVTPSAVEGSGNELKAHIILSDVSMQFILSEVEWARYDNSNDMNSVARPPSLYDTQDSGRFFLLRT
jgi:hypothetical protein